MLRPGACHVHRLSNKTLRFIPGTQTRAAELNEHSIQKGVLLLEAQPCMALSIPAPIAFPIRK